MCKLTQGGVINTDIAGLLELCKKLAPCIHHCQLAQELVFDMADNDDLPVYLRCYATRALAPVLKSSWIFGRVLSLLAEDEGYLVCSAMQALAHSHCYNDEQAVKTIVWAMSREDIDFSCVRQMAMRTLARPVAEGSTFAIEQVVGHLLHGETLPEVKQMGCHVIGHALLATHPETERLQGLRATLHFLCNDQSEEVRKAAEDVLAGRNWSLDILTPPLH